MAKAAHRNKSTARRRRGGAAWVIPETDMDAGRVDNPAILTKRPYRGLSLAPGPPGARSSRRQRQSRGASCFQAAGQAGSGMRSLSPGTGTKASASQSRAACSMRSRLDETKFQKM